MLKIGEFSRLSCISVRTLRHWDELGLLEPGYTDPSTGYRYYSEEQLPLAGRIAALRDMDFGLSAISEILKCGADRQSLDRIMQAQEAALTSLLEETRRRLRLLRSARRQIEKEEQPMKYSVTLKTLPERYVASVRMTIPGYAHEGMLWSTLMQETARMRLIPDEPCYRYTIYHDAEFREADVDEEIHMTVRGRYQDTRHVRFKAAPAVTFASATWKGGYDKIPEVNAAVAEWVCGNGYHYDGPAFYIHHVSYHETQNPDEFVTEICYPVRKQ